jgi:flagellar hook-associated protein 2
VYSGEAATALNAIFTLDGIEVSRESNTVTDVVDGLALTLKSKQADADPAVTLQVAVDKEAIKTKLQKFVADYNEALKYITTKTSIDAAAKTRGVFSSDSSILAVRSSLRSMIGQSVPGVSTGNPSVLSDIGIKINRDGTLTLSDTALLDKVLTGDVRKVSDLFVNASGSGLAEQLKTFLEKYVSTGGEIDTSSTSASTQITGIKARIARLQEQIDKRGEAYRNQFAQIQVLIAKASRQQQMMQSLGYY